MRLACVALPSVVFAEVPHAVSRHAGLTVGCLMWDTGIGEYQETVDGIEGLEACQRACRERDFCNQFSLGAGNVCKLGDRHFGSDLQAEAGAISGPKHCSEPAVACTEKLVNSFPRAAKKESMAAWSGGFQPARAQCWERTPSGTYGSCSTIEYRETTAGVDRCDQMKAIELRGATCQEHCEADPQCSVWVLGDEGQCWAGIGSFCYSGTSMGAKAGGRIVRGHAEVLMSLKSQKLAGLIQVLTPEDLVSLVNMERKTHAVCRDICYSVLECQFWQVIQDEGCFIESPSQPVPYPLVSSQLSFNSRVVAGEYVRRTCRQGLGEKVDAFASDSSGPLWAWALAVWVLLCCTVALMGWFLFAHGCCERRRRKKKHGLEGSNPQVSTLQPNQPLQKFAVYPLMQPVGPTVSRGSYVPGVVMNSGMDPQMQPIMQQAGPATFGEFTPRGGYRSDI
eukprot:TRINITY_DN70172_c0_g1_i1.p1 TRINITY_DN70172_c0_g1~~TRINITY_DN70172_c0_g1_i1.p1  ORF type:complete len:451 (+),score=33.59 TRINITY_DN70172_c0_g1_i1:60-1412(+)